MNKEVEELQKKVKRLEEILELQTKAHQAAREEIQKFNNLKDNFLSVASHELRTPMSVIRGYADLLLSSDFGDLNDQQNKFVTKILNNVEQLTNLINNMLDISKLEAGKMHFNIKTVNLSELIAQIVNNHQILFKHKQQTLTFIDNTKSEANLETDPEKLGIVLKNIISNAHKFTPVAGKVAIKAQKNNDYWHICITDTGSGIPKSERNNVFKKFQQADNSLQKKHSGTGLGLSITKKIIEQLDGEIWIEDNPDHPTGLSFNINLPT